MRGRVCGVVVFAVLASVLSAAPASAAAAGYVWLRYGPTEGAARQVNDVFASPHESIYGVTNNDVWFATQDGLWRSRNGAAATRRALNGIPVTQVAADVTGTTLFAALADGVWISTDSGQSWGDAPVIPATAVYEIEPLTITPSDDFPEAFRIFTNAGYWSRDPNGGLTKVKAEATRSFCGAANGDGTGTQAWSSATGLSVYWVGAGTQFNRLAGKTIHLVTCQGGAEEESSILTALASDGVYSSTDGGQSFIGPFGPLNMRWDLAEAPIGDLYAGPPGVRAVVAGYPARGNGLPAGEPLNSAMVDVRPSASTAAYVATDVGAYRLVKDTSVPIASMTKPSTSFARSATVAASWTGADVVTRVRSYDVRRRAANYNGGFGAFTAFRTNTTSRSGTYNARLGTTQCFSVRAEDLAGNVSAYSKERCTAVPVDDRGLTRDARWQAVSASSYYRGTAVTTQTKTATMSLGGVQTKRVNVLAVGCPACGVVQVWFAGAKIATIDLAAPSRAVRYYPVPAFTAVRTGKLQLFVSSSGKPVTIDAVALSRV